MKNYRKIGGTGASYLSGLASGQSQGGGGEGSGLITIPPLYSHNSGSPSSWDGTYETGEILSTYPNLYSTGNTSYRTTTWFNITPNGIYSRSGGSTGTYWQARNAAGTIIYASPSGYFFPGATVAGATQIRVTYTRTGEPIPTIKLAFIME